jgi:hypothetical protein
MNTVSFLKHHLKSIILGIFACAAIVGYMYTAVLFRNEKREIRMLTAEMDVEQRRWSSSHTLERVLNETEEDRIYIRELILDEMGVIGMMSDIKALGEKTEVSVSPKSIAVEHINTEHSSGTSVLSVHIGVEGAHVNIVRFLDILSDAPYAIDIRSVGMEFVGEKGVWEGSVSFVIRNFRER